MTNLRCVPGTAEDDPTLTPLRQEIAALEADAEQAQTRRLRRDALRSQLGEARAELDELEATRVDLRSRGETLAAYRVRVEAAHEGADR